MYLGLALFADAGQIFERHDLPRAGDWREGLGAGLRYHWHSTIVRADYGSSSDRSAIYITFSQVF
jgi:outer membrane translocation and assembly module TamA